MSEDWDGDRLVLECRGGPYDGVCMTVDPADPFIWLPTGFYYRTLLVLGRMDWAPRFRVACVLDWKQTSDD